MFWSGDLLSINGGRFSTIWLLGLGMKPKDLDDKDLKKKLQDKELLKINIQKLLQEFARFVPISEEHVALRVSSYCVLGFARVLRIKSKHLRISIIRQRLPVHRRQKIKAAAIDAPPTSAKGVTLKENKKGNNDKRDSMGHVNAASPTGMDLNSREFLDKVDDFERKLWEEAFPAEDAEEQTDRSPKTINPNVVDNQQITMPDPDIGFRNTFGRINYDDEEDMGVPFDRVGEDGGGGAAAVTMPDPSMDFGAAAPEANFGQLDDGFDLFPSREDQGERVAASGDNAGGLFDGPGLFDEPPEPEVTRAEPSQPPPAAAPKKRTAEDAMSDAQTATTTENDAKKRKKTENLTPPLMVDDDLQTEQQEQVPDVPPVEEDQVPPVDEVLAGEDQAPNARTSVGAKIAVPPPVADELQPVEGQDQAAPGAGQNLSGGLNLEDEVVARVDTPPISFELDSLESQDQPNNSRRQLPGAATRGKGKRKLAIDRKLQISEEEMKEQIGGEAYRRNACIKSGMDDNEDMQAQAKFGHHLQVKQTGKKLTLIMPTTRAGERGTRLLKFQQKVVMRNIADGPTDYYDFEEDGDDQLRGQNIEPEQQDGVQENEPQVLNDLQQERGEDEQENNLMTVDLLQDPVPELPQEQQTGNNNKAELDESSWEDMEESPKADVSSRIRASTGSRDSTRRESGLREDDTYNRKEGTTASEQHLRVPELEKRPRSRSMNPQQNDDDHNEEEEEVTAHPIGGGDGVVVDELPPALDPSLRAESTHLEDVSSVAAAAVQPDDETLMPPPPPPPPAVEEVVARASSNTSVLSSQDEEEEEAEPFMTVGEVVERLRSHPNRPINFNQLYPSSDRENTTRHVALAFQHLLRLQDEGKVDMAQHEANFKDPLVIDFLM